uniref:SPARC-related modular calcium-binding protein 2-like isoform X1 n=3 Tax=Castor canadensis TaxID=51338 RepID=A0A8B7UUK7_CASCN|nr:SPARC-related modular calcium-binding protein 2-like isoform X1 [Castor canadensis]
MLLPQLCWLPLLAGLLPPAPAQKFSALTFLRVDQDKDRDCSLDCAGSPQKPLCASDGRTFLSRCEFQRAKCKDPQLEIAYRGNCKDVSRCVAERKYTQEQARKEFQQVFIPECNDDGTYSQVQCHSYTGYCWCVTPNGRPVSGTAVAHKTPRCPGSVNEKLPQREGTGKAVSLQIFSVLNSDDAAAPALETQPQGDEEDIASRYPTLWTEQVKSRQNKTNKNAASSCDQEHQSALEEAKQPKNDNVVIPECAHGGLYKPVQCHPSTGYCWCVLVDTGRPIPGTSTR